MVNKAGNDERVAGIVSKALRQPPAKRESYLRLVCSDDQELYQETAAAVKLEERMVSFLMLPAMAPGEFPRPFETGQIILRPGDKGRAVTFRKNRDSDGRS